MKKDKHDNIFWIIGAFVLVYMILFSGLGEILFSTRMLNAVWPGYENCSAGVHFVFNYYVPTTAPFIGFFIYTAITKRNRFILHSALPGRDNTVRILLFGLLVGFVMNFSCIVLALLHGDIKLTLSPAAGQVLFFLFALLFVFIQSSSEELWCRGFLYERLNVRYPLWVAIVVNGVLFGLLHTFNPGVSVLAIAGIIVCGISFSLARWYTKSLWFVMAIHTAWNFTQNFIFGLPNSGLVSEASIFALDAANAKTSWIYSASFGVEGGIPSLIADGALGVICLILAARKGRLKELGQRGVK